MKSHKTILTTWGIVMALMLTVGPVGAIDENDYTRNVAIVIWNGAEILDWGGPSEVFESAGRVGRHGEKPAFRMYTVSKTKDPIVSQRFVKVVPDYSIEDAPKPDIIILPGGGTSNVMKDPEFLAWASQAAKEAEVALSVCTGAFILGKAGLLKGKDATTWYGALDGLEEQFPETRVHRGRRFVDNGQVVTTAGVSAGIDGSLHVVARLLGRYVADRTAQYMEYRWTPEPYLARDYSVLNPSLDDDGRLLQRADIFANEKDHSSAIELYEKFLEENPGDLRAWYRLGHATYKAKRYDVSVAAYLKASELEDVRVWAFYNAACSAALMNDIEQAFEYLDMAIQAGFDDRENMMNDPDLEALREDSRFEQVVAKI